MNQNIRKRRVEPSKKDKGARRHRTGLSDQLNSYLGHHRLVARDSLQRLLRMPMSSLMTWLVIGIALALPGGLLVALNNLEAVSRGWEGGAQISLYLHQSIAERDGRKLANQLQLKPEIVAVEFISSTQALAEFQRLSGYGDVLQHLDSNPLPSVLIVKPVDVHTESASTYILYESLAQLSQVDQAVIDMAWVQRLYSIMALGKRMTFILAALLSLGVLLVIGNTIRLAIESRRDEIVIVKLVGATNAFVRRPFLYTGLWYGLGGGLVGWLIISVGLIGLMGPVSELAGLYQSGFSLQGLSIGETLMLWLSAGLLGLLGAWLAVGRHLGAIEPR